MAAARSGVDCIGRRESTQHAMSTRGMPAEVGSNEAWVSGVGSDPDALNTPGELPNEQDIQQLAGAIAVRRQRGASDHTVQIDHPHLSVDRR